MDRADLAPRIDHLALSPTTTAADLRDALDDSLRWGTRACVPPCYVADASGYAPTVSLVSVVGFPGGQHSTAAKREEAIAAWDDGAVAVDVTANAGWLRAGDGDAVREDVEEVVAAVPIPVWVVVETRLLDREEVRTACERAEAAGAAGLVTSTGFGEGGAAAEDVALMSEFLPVKAVGGIHSLARAEAVLEAGAERIGTSRPVDLLEAAEAPEE